MDQTIISELQPHIVIVEEAAEVLEVGCLYVCTTCMCVLPVCVYCLSTYCVALPVSACVLCDQSLLQANMLGGLLIGSQARPPQVHWHSL